MSTNYPPTPPAGQPYYQPSGPPVKPKKPWYKKVWVWVLIVFFFFIIIPKGGGSSDTVTPASTPIAEATQAAPAQATQAAPAQTTQAAPAQTTKAPTEAATVVTAKKMISDLEANALKAQTTYDNKRVQVTGYVDNIDAQGKYFSIVGSPGDFVLTGVTIDITPDQKATVANFDKDQKVVVTGTVTSIGEVLGYRVKAETIK